MDEVTEKIIATVNTQKGEMIGINAALAAMARALTPYQLERFLSEFDIEIAHARSALAYSTAPDEVLASLETYVQMWNSIRTQPNQS